MRHSAKQFLVVLTVAAALVAALRAEVFMRVGAGTPAQAFSELGGASMRTGAVSINGRPGTLGVFGFDKPLRTLAGELAPILPFHAETDGKICPLPATANLRSILVHLSRSITM